MWEKLSRFILSNRLSIILFFFLITIFMGYKTGQVRLSFAGTKALPTTDTAFTRYNKFKKNFGEDGSVMVLGVQSPKIWELNTFNAWSTLTSDIQKLHGVKQELSSSNLFELAKDTLNKKFILRPLIKNAVSTPAEMDSIRKSIYNLSFYDGLIFNSKLIHR